MIFLALLSPALNQLEVRNFKDGCMMQREAGRNAYISNAQYSYSFADWGAPMPF